MMMDIIALGVSSVVSFFLSSWGHSVLLKIANAKNLVDQPNARKLQKRPVPVLGGVAVFFGVVSGLSVGLFFTEKLHALFPLLLSMIVMFYMGFMDDTEGLTPRIRLLAEVLTIACMIYGSGMCVDCFHGLWGVEFIPLWLAIPLTILAGVGIVNAINMIDGVNGLSSGLCIIYCIVFGGIFVKTDDMVNAMLAFAMGAGLLPFLIHNVFGDRSRMYIGDTGTMLMGTVLSWFVIVLTHGNSRLMLSGFSENIGVVALCLAVLSVPIFDTLRVMMQRMVCGRSPFKPDRTHLHHTLIDVGVSHSFTALSEIVLDLFIIGVWFVAYKLGCSCTVQFWIVVGISLIMVVGLYFFLYYQLKYATRLLMRLRKLSIRTHLGHTDWWLRFQHYLDSKTDSAV